MAVRVGRWDCKVCGTKAIYGPDTQCPNCGASRPRNVRFYLPEDAELVRKADQLREARAGVDWICGHCDTQNKAVHTECVSCGNPRDELSKDVDLQTRTYETGQVPRMGDQPPESPHTRARQLGKRRPNRTPTIILGLVILVAAFWGLSQIPVGTEVNVVAFEWERTIQMEHFEPVQKEDWNTPKGAYNISSFQAVHHYNQVLRGYETRTRNVQVQVGTERYVCGQVDMGNGYFQDKYCSRPIYETRQETYKEPVYDQVPVYKTKYKYTVKEWVAKQSYKLLASGNDQQPNWPTKTYKEPKNWREGKKTQTYLIRVKEEDGNTHQEKLPFDYWKQLSKGQTLAAQKSLLTGKYFGLKES
ncbi:MAG: Ran-binding zinc finger domain-containing protein [Bacteroidota bacterium]